MSNHFLLYDEVKIRQIDLAREVEIARVNKLLRRNQKSISFSKKVRIFLKLKK